MTFLSEHAGLLFIAYGGVLVACAVVATYLAWRHLHAETVDRRERVLTDAMVRENARRLAHDSGRFIDEYERETWTPYDGLTVVGKLSEFELAAQRRAERRGPVGGMSA